MVGNFLKVGKSKGNCQNKMIFTESGTYSVPEGVTQIFISGCAAGGSGMHAGDNGSPGLAGEFVIRRILLVVPKQIIPITVGMGNTLIGDIALITASISAAYENDILGYKTGYNGGRGPDTSDQGYPLYWWKNAPGGYGGAFGYGGGGGGLKNVSKVAPSGKSGSDVMSGSAEAGGNAVGVIGMQPTKIYNNGGNGSTLSSSGSAGTGGGGAGGYGAGGGNCTDNGGSYITTRSTPGGGSPGIVIIEW